MIRFLGLVIASMGVAFAIVNGDWIPGAIFGAIAIACTWGAI